MEEKSIIAKKQSSETNVLLKRDRQGSLTNLVKVYSEGYSLLDSTYDRQNQHFLYSVLHVNTLTHSLCGKDNTVNLL